MDERVQDKCQNSDSESYTAETDILSEMMDLLIALLRGWYIILFCLILSVAAALFLFLLAPNQYSGSARVEFIGAEGDNQRAAARTVGLDAGYLDGQIEKMRSDSLARRVAAATIDKLAPAQLETSLSAGVSAYLRKFEISNRVTAALARVGLTEVVDLPRNVASTSDGNNDLAERLELIRDAITVYRVRQTHIAEVTVRSRDPELSAELANQVASSFIADRRDRERKEIIRSADWQGNQLDDLVERIASTEADLQALRDQTDSRLNIAAMETARARNETYMQLYDELLAQHFETLQRASSPRVDARIVERAVPSSQRDAPSLKVYAAISTGAGFALGSLIVLIRRRTKTRRVPG